MQVEQPLGSPRGSHCLGKNAVPTNWDIVPRGAVRAQSDVHPSPNVEQAALATKLSPHADTLAILHVLTLAKGL